MNEYLMHHGVKGQHWGVRRYQNADGSLTSKGRKRYLNEDGSYNTDTLRGKLKNWNDTVNSKAVLRSNSIYSKKAAKEFDRYAKGNAKKSFKICRKVYES